MMNLRTFLFVLLTGLPACDKPSDKITVAAAANVQYVMEDIRKAFEKETGKPVQIVVSSSGKLTSQIREGAPFDVFVSADIKYPKEIYDQGGAEAEPKIYAYGKLVIWSMKDSANLQALTRPAIHKIAIPNPTVAPYGEAAVQAMQKTGLYDQLKSKIVQGESISQTAQYITTGAADIGFNALSIVLSPEMKGKGKWQLVDSTLYQPIAQSAILLRHSEDSPKKEPSKQFFDFLYSAKGQAIFKKYGYGTVKR